MVVSVLLELLTENILEVKGGELLKYKKLNILSFLLVTPEGFEPPTNRAETCHSIQLNYGV